MYIQPCVCSTDLTSNVKVDNTEKALNIVQISEHDLNIYSRVVTTQAVDKHLCCNLNLEPAGFHSCFVLAIQ